MKHITDFGKILWDRIIYLDFYDRNDVDMYIENYKMVDKYFEEKDIAKAYAYYEATRPLSRKDKLAKISGI